MTTSAQPEILLIGRLRSPFVRRTAILLDLLGLDFGHEPIAALTEQEALRAHNPVGRVPALRIGERVLVDSLVIALTLLDLYDEEGALLPRAGWERADALRLIALSNGATERAVTAYYERSRRPEDKIWPDWIDLARSQARQGLDALEGEAPDPAGPLDYVQVCLVTSLAFLETAEPGLLDPGQHPRLSTLLRTREAEPPFTARS